MGGYGALRLAIARPRFGSIAALSPAIWQNVPQADLGLPGEQLDLIRDAVYFHVDPGGMFETGVDLPNPGPHFSGAYGEPFDSRRFNALNVFTLLNEQGNPGEMPRLLLAIGDHDSHDLWRGTFALFETLKAKNFAVHLRVGDGDHDWNFWRSALPEALAFLARVDAPPRHGD
jgi:enterochelin esterase family protein